MTTAPAAIPMVPRSDTHDIRIIVTFTPADPVGATEVEIEGLDVGIWRYYQLVAAAAQRLTVYADAYRRAAEDDREVAR